MARHPLALLPLLYIQSPSKDMPHSFKSNLKTYLFQLAYHQTEPALDDPSLFACTVIMLYHLYRPILFPLAGLSLL